MSRRRPAGPVSSTPGVRETYAPGSTTGVPGRLYVVAVPIGDPDDLSIRALRTLCAVDIIASEDPEATHRLLAHHRAEAEGTAQEHQPSITSYGHDNRDDKTAVLISRLLEGQSVALVVDRGTPGVYDPGAYLVAAAHAHTIPVVSIPGPSALTAALSVSGLNGDQVEFVGTVPSTRASRLSLLRKLARSLSTTVLFGIRRGHLRELAALFGPRAVCLCRNLGSAQEQVIRTKASALPDHVTASRADNAELWTLVLAGRPVHRRRNPRSTQKASPNSKAGWPPTCAD